MNCSTGLSRIGFNNLLGADPFIAADGESAEGVPLMKRDLSTIDAISTS